MSQLTLWDHALAFVVFVVYPVYSMLTVGRAIEDIRKRGEGARLAPGLALAVRICEERRS